MLKEGKKPEDGLLKENVEALEFIYMKRGLQDEVQWGDIYP